MTKARRSLLIEAKQRLSLSAHRRVRTLLDGNYRSVFQGRSLDFEDLREYVQGDDVKDIDWKATARSGKLLVRRFTAMRQHRLMLVVNGGRSMTGLTPSNHVKFDIALACCGIFAYLAVRNSDRVGAAFGDSSSQKIMPPQGSMHSAERCLQEMLHFSRHSQLAGSSSQDDLTALLMACVKKINRRGMVLIVSDDSSFDQATHEPLLRRLVAQHELMWISIADTDAMQNKVPDNSRVVMTESGSDLPRYLLRKRKLRDEVAALDISTRQTVSRHLKRIGISNTSIENSTEIVKKITRLLEEQKHVRVDIA